jgi:DNA-binding transcriptional LysR family regulator
MVGLMDKFEAMQRFVLVAQTNSFTRAAEMLGLPKSTISSAVQSLEKQLGTRLFHRSTRRINLTQDGEAYLPQCQAILAELDALESQFQHQNEDVRGVLRVDMPSRFASTIVFPHLSEWLDAYPNTQLKISCADYDIDPTREAVDCLIRVGVLNDSALIARPLVTYRIVNCVSPGYIEKYGEPDKLADLEQHQLIDYAQKIGNSPAMFEYVEDGQIKQLSMPSALAVNSTDAYLSACLSGLGIAQIPKIGVIEYLKKGELVSILSRFEAEPMPVSLLYPSRRQIPKRLSLFMDWIESLVQRLEAECVDLNL